MSDNVLRQNMQVELKDYHGIANISPIGTFVFSILCFVFWAADIGIVGDGATLAIGLIGLAVFVPYLIVGVSLTRSGVCLGGNTYLLFGAVFGGCGGLTNTFGPIFAHLGIPFDGKIVGYAFLLAGLYLVFMLPSVAKATKVDFLIFLFGALGVTGSGLTVLGILPPASSIFDGWALFLDGVVGFYSVIAIVSESMGVNIPMGKPIRK